MCQPDGSFTLWLSGFHPAQPFYPTGKHLPQGWLCRAMAVPKHRLCHALGAGASPCASHALGPSLQGVKEVTLLGQNVNSFQDTSEVQFCSAAAPSLSRGFSTVYKAKPGGLRFSHLLDQVSRIDPEIRIRFTSSHPKDFPDEVGVRSPQLAQLTGTRFFRGSLSPCQGTATPGEGSLIWQSLCLEQALLGACSCPLQGSLPPFLQGAAVCGWASL